MTTKNHNDIKEYNMFVFADGSVFSIGIKWVSLLLQKQKGNSTTVLLGFYVFPNNEKWPGRFC